MKELRRKIILCLAPVVFGLFVIAIAGYNYSNPPLRIGGSTPWWARAKFNLGVDLVGGTILVYEIDPEKKPENYSKDQLVSALKRRLDPADLYNITIRPLSDTRVEIILPTGGRHQAAAAKKAWDNLLDDVAEKWNNVRKDQLENVRRGDKAALSQKIHEIDSAIKVEDINDFIKSKYSEDTQLTRDRVEATKDLISRVGSLEFRVLANRNDDSEALDISRGYFDAAAASWKEFLDQVRAQYPNVDKPGEANTTRLEEIPCGDRDGVIDLIVNREREKDRDQYRRTVDLWVRTHFKPNPQLDELMKREVSGQPPPPPIGGDGKKFRVNKLNDGVDHRFSYSWIEIGKNELHSIHLNNDARAEALWKEVAKARAEGKLIENGGAVGGLPGAYSPGSQRDFRVPLYSRKITNTNRLSPKDKEDKKYEYFLLTRDPEPGKEVTGEMLTSASETPDQKGGRAVGFQFNAKGSALFGELTGANSPPPNDRESRRLLAIVLDGQIESAPGVEQEIRGNGIIHGRYTKEDVDMLVNILRSGALPATLKPQPVSENTLGATLGEDTINKGTTAIVIALVAILVFMLVYYRFAGFVACVALIANLILTIAFMIIVNATFTLPGLAGLVLTLGMAVDANVLIYERLREERERGASLSLALRNGYDRAFPTIIDTHLTSILTAVVLYIVGNDQLKGFGISLTVGLLISLFTALYVTRTIFHYWELRGWLKKLSMAKLFSKPNFHFMAIRKPVFIITVVTALFGVAVFVARGPASLNMDFVGGTLYSGELTKRVNINDLRDKLEKESYQQKMLALASDPEFDKDRGIWKLTYKEGESGDRVREIRITESGVTPAELRRRAETLPEPTVEQIFTSNTDQSRGNESSLFTVRTTEKSADLVAASVSRLLGDDLKRTKLDDYTLKRITLFFPKAMRIEEARRVVLPALARAGLIKEPQTPVGLKALPMAGVGLAAVADALAHGDDATLAGKEAGTLAGTYKAMDLNLKDPADGAKLLAALRPLTVDDPAKKKERTFDIQVSEAQLNLNSHAYLSQVKTLMDSVLRGQIAQEVTLGEVDPKDESDGRYSKMKLGMPPVDGNKFAEKMETFKTELSNRPLPVRLENFDTLLAADMQQRALYAIVASWGAMLMFLWFRFGNWTFGLAAVLCLVHDVCFTLGMIAACHYLYPSFITDFLLIRDFKIDLPAVAALLTLIGFSVNDTIVVFDRIREVRGKNPNLTPEMINDSINQTLSRTVLTSLTAWLVVFVLYVAGGEGVHLFAFVMVIGVIVGTYSSIFVASPLLLILGEGAPRPGAVLRPRQEARAETESA
jgi:protein-export membrane protein SecD/preprotein translocase SecF subunit